MTITSIREAIPQNPTSDEAFLNLVNSRYKHSENAHSQTRVKVKRWYDLYRGHFTGRQYHKWRNDVHLPLVFSTIQGDVARKQQTMWSSWPYVHHFGYGAEDIMGARKNDLLISAQLKDCSTYKKCYDMLVQSDIYGTGITLASWRFDEEMLVRREQGRLPITQQLVETARTERVVTFNGPNFEVIDILDAFPQPGVHDVEDMDWFIHRDWLDYDDIRALEKLGVFDKGSSSTLRMQHEISSMREYMDEKYTWRTDPSGVQDGPTTEKFARPVEIWHMWGRVPSEFVPDDGGTMRVVTVANGRLVLRNEPMPHAYGRIPIDHYSPLRDPHYFFGPGKAEIAEKMQVAANRLACQKLDALDLFVDPMWYGNRHAGIDTRRMYTRPGGVIFGDLPPGEAIQALIPDLGGLQNAYQEVQDLWRWIQQASGITDPALGMPGPDRETATAYKGREQGMSVRLLLEARMCEEEWLEPLCRKFRAMNRQWLPIGQEIKMLGSSAVTDIVTGEPIPPEEMTMSAEDLYRDYDVRAMGSTQAVSKFERKQDMAALFSMIGSHPAGMGLVNWLAMFREMFLAYDMRNVDELLQPPVTQQSMIQMGQMAAGGASGGIPSQGAGQPTGDMVSGLIGNLGESSGA